MLVYAMYVYALILTKILLVVVVAAVEGRDGAVRALGHHDLVRRTPVRYTILLLDCCNSGVDRQF